MKRIARIVTLAALGGSLFQFGNCTRNLSSAARDGALSAWESFVNDQVGNLLDQANIIDTNGDGA